jgi:hypothetical protein
LIEYGVQNLVLVEKNEKGITRSVICEVLYVHLRGRYGLSESSLFSDLAVFCETLEKTKKRKDIANMTGDFLKGIPQDEIPIAVNLILGRIFPQRNQRILNLSVASILEVLNELIKVSERDYHEAFLEARDFGEAVRILLEKGRLIQIEKRLTIKNIFHTFEEIAIGAVYKGQVKGQKNSY